MSNTIFCPHCRREIPIADAVDQAIQQCLTNEKARLLQEAQIRAREFFSTELTDLHARLDSATDKLRDAQNLEAQLRKERRQLENHQHELQLGLQRTLDEERARIREEAVRQANESHHLKEADQNKLIEDMRKQITELKRRAEQGTPSLQGEVMEMDLEDLLRAQFPQDDFEPVPIGVHGGDLIHRVRDSSGQVCGVILWESKRTKNWNDAWLQKLRDDQAACRADLAAILSAQLPKSICTFGCVEGIWITGRSCLPGLAAALRAALIEVARTRRSLEDRQVKTSLLVDYVSSSAFRLKIEGVVQVYESLKEDLNAERRTHQRMWLKRERQLERSMANVSGVMGELSGIIDAELPVLAEREPLREEVLEEVTLF